MHPRAPGATTHGRRGEPAELRDRGRDRCLPAGQGDDHRHGGSCGGEPEPDRPSGAQGRLAGGDADQRGGEVVRDRRGEVRRVRRELDLGEQHDVDEPQRDRVTGPPEQRSVQVGDACGEDALEGGCRERERDRALDRRLGEQRAGRCGDDLLGDLAADDRAGFRCRETGDDAVAELAAVRRRHVDAAGMPSLRISKVSSLRVWSGKVGGREAADGHRDLRERPGATASPSSDEVPPALARRTALP
jgi:hypothetical protein